MTLIERLPGCADEAEQWGFHLWAEVFRASADALEAKAADIEELQDDNKRLNAELDEALMGREAQAAEIARLTQERDDWRAAAEENERGAQDATIRFQQAERARDDYQRAVASAYENIMSLGERAAAEEAEIARLTARIAEMEGALRHDPLLAESSLLLPTTEEGE